MRITLRINNYTGADLSLIRKDNWDGGYDGSPPDTIDANEEAVFDIANGGSSQTSGALVYRVLNPAQPLYDCMVAFCNPNTGQNKVLCKCAQQGYFTNDRMENIRRQVNNSESPFSSDASVDGAITTAAITREDSATCLAIIAK